MEEVEMLLRRFDDLGDGTVDVDFLREVLKNSLQNISDREVDSLLQELGAGAENGRISFTDFVNYIFGVPSPRRVQPTSAKQPKEFTVASTQPQKQWAVPIRLDRSIAREFFDLSQNGKVQAEYVWLDSCYTDGKSFDLCSKSLTLEAPPQSAADLPCWSYSGSDDDRDVILVPRRFYMDPFRRGENILVLADCYTEPEPNSGLQHGEPVSFNSRAACYTTMARAEATGAEPWFGIEQEYFLLDVHTGWPLGWPRGDFPGDHHDYYCATGATKAVGRDIVESHYRACLYAGVQIGGVNSEVAPGQWEFQVGPGSGIAPADDLWMARYILQRVCEVETAATRAKSGGVDAMMEQIEKLRLRHADHMKVYGEGNERRLTGLENTASMDEFSCGVGCRDTTIRIPAKVGAAGFGYYEDRRPAANMDPYLVTGIIVETTIFSGPPPGSAAAASGVTALAKPGGHVERGGSRSSRPRGVSSGHRLDLER